MSFWGSCIRLNITLEGSLVGQPLVAVPAEFLGTNGDSQEWLSY